MKIQVSVECRYGEESTWVSDINQEEFDALNPVLAEIEQRRGYFPTGDYYVSPDPKPEELYSHHQFGWTVLNRILPSPIHGFGKINEVHVFMNDPISLYI